VARPQFKLPEDPKEAEKLEPWITVNPEDGSVTLKLECPVPNGKEPEITELVIKRPRGKHLRTFGQEAGMAELLDLISRCSGQSAKAVIDELDVADAMRASKVAGCFFDSGQ
jgi:hypothetical protein